MKIGLHYHIPVRQGPDGTLETQSFYGLFVDSLAAMFAEVVLFAYTPLVSEIPSLNYRIQAGNITYVDLGIHASVPKRILRFWRHYWLIRGWSDRIDILLVRSPTPLVLLLCLLRHKIKTVLFLVGDYVEGAKHVKFGFFKKSVIRLLSHLVERAQHLIINDNTFLANSQVLLDQYRPIARNSYLIKTTTLVEEDFFERKFDPSGRPLRVLFTGRIDESKGLPEIVDACILLASQIDIEFHFAGLLVKGRESLPKELIERANGTALESRIIYHGLKKVGEELNAVYRMCDIYVVGSKSDFEGFPRTIWEAMANSLPVIASPKGSISAFLRDRFDALLLKEVSPHHIAERILELRDNPSLACDLIRNGLSLAKENTLTGQARRVRDTLSSVEK